MKKLECEFESEVLAAVLQSRWPDRTDAELRTHATHCPICRDVIAISGAIDHAREDTRTAVMVPDSGRVWWLAQMRARREAAKAAGRPITAVQVVAFACAIALLGACVQSALRWMGTLIAQHSALALAVAACLIAIPAAVYLTIFAEPRA